MSKPLAEAGNFVPPPAAYPVANEAPLLNGEKPSLQRSIVQDKMRSHMEACEAA